MSTHDPIHLLEPANLLAPLDLGEHDVGYVSPSLGVDRGTSRTVSTRRPVIAAPAAAVGRSDRWVLKSALIVAGAIACFAAGVALPQLTSIGSVGLDALQTTRNAIRPAEQGAAVPIKADDATVAMPNESGRHAAAAANEPTAIGTVQHDRLPPPNDDPNLLGGSAASPPAASGAVAGGAPQAGEPAPQAGTPASPDPQRADMRASEHQVERTRSSRPVRRATRRDSADRRPVDSDVPTARSSGREERDPYRTSDWHRDWAAADNAPAARSWERWQEHDADRGSSWRGRSRYDEYAREGDRRAVGRAVREDDRVWGRAPRDDRPVVTFPPFRSDW